MNIAELQLWPHQHAAVVAASAYFDSKSTKACLIHMPTGTGKTGVIAVLASIRAGVAPVLVVCPSAALVEQLETQILTGFWETINADDIWRPSFVWQLLPSGVSKLVEKLAENENGRMVVVCTIQALQQIQPGAEGYAELRDLIGTIIFDEGHREPAPMWLKLSEVSAPLPCFLAPRLLEMISRFSMSTTTTFTSCRSRRH
jgi:superfamily II DNA or RNA helicase